ncbi:MAG: hypothetical protein MUF78_07990 [Candidatus Edwardsbacteria bacterium]|nr:hypothetical protein [Candidatus Edwardsbacteria bacterium]
MTIDQFIAWAGSQGWLLLAFFAALPLAAAGLNRLAGSAAAHGPWRYGYAVLAYLCCIPGMFAASITLYTLFLLRANLLRVNVLVYFLPIVSMAATLLVIGRAVRFERIPGFGRLAGLMVLLGASFLTVLLLDRLRVLAVFGGSVVWLGLAALALYVVLRLGLRKLTRSGN